MVAYVLAGDATLRDIGNAAKWGVTTARAGGDTIDTNGWKITIDQDTRYGLSGTTSTTLGSITINAAKGGECHIDATKVWLIPYNTGSGTLTLGTAITLGAVTANTIGIYTSMTTAPVNTGATGWLKVTGATDIPPSSGTFTQAGLTFTITGTPIQGFIEINGDDASTVFANRLGTFRVTGAWYTLGTTTGTSNQTLQIPNNGVARYAAGVFIEKTAGLEDYEFYPNAGTTTTTGTDAVRGKVVWIDATGLVRIGNSGAATNGYTPTVGRKVVVPNIFFECNTTAARTANVIPNATVATRYDFTCTGGGVLEIDKCNMAWYLSASQAYSVNVSNSCFVDAILLSEVASPMTFTKAGVGNKPTTALLTNPLTMTYCFAGGTFTDCVWARVSMAASAAHTNVLTDIAGFTFINDTTRANTIRGNNTTYALNATRIQNCVWTTPTIIQGAFSFTTCTNVTVTNTIFCDCVSGTTVTTYSGYVWMVTSNTLNCVFSGLTMPVTNTQPYTGLLAVSVASANIKLRNIGTRVSPINMGTVNACGLIYTLATASQDVKIQRVYVSNTRTGIMTGDNSCTRVTQENTFGDYADAVDVMAVLNFKVKGMGGTGALTAQTSVYGTHWRDSFTSTTAGRIALLMNEPTSLTSNLVTLVNGANFTSAGGLYMPVIGQSATIDMDYYALGHTGFSNTALVMAGGTVGNYRFEYSIDKNDGGGWSALTSSAYTAALLGTALSGITGIDASKGIKLRLKISTTTTNTTAITSVYVTTISSTTAQDYQYPLDTFTLSISGLVSGSDITIIESGTENVLSNTEDNIGTTFNYIYETPVTVDLVFNKPGYYPTAVRNFVLLSSDASLPVVQSPDASYL